MNKIGRKHWNIAFQWHTPLKKNHLQTGKMIDFKKVKSNYQKEVQGRLSGENVWTESSNSVQNLWAKQAKNTEIFPLNGVWWITFLVHTGSSITVKNQLKWKYYQEVQGRFSGKQVRTESLNSVRNLR